MKLTLPLLALLFATHIFAIDSKSVVLKGSEAKAEVPEANMLLYKSFSSIPVFIRFEQAKQLDLYNWQQWMQSNFFDNDEQYGFELIGSEEDQLGMVHYRFNQTYDGIKVQFATWIVHTKNNYVVSMNGELFDIITMFKPSLSESEALEVALDYVDAEIYKWEIDLEEQVIQHVSHDHNATYYPSGEKVIINTDPTLKEVDLRLAWKFSIYAHEPMSRQEVYVDATSGYTIFKQDLIHHADSNGTAVTNYNGNFNIVADYTGSSFRLREIGRGNGISTYNLNSGTNGLGTDIFDNDNVWNSTVLSEMSGPDAHFGTEMTYDFFFDNFGRNSIDDNGFELISRVNYGNNFTNAFWDGNVMTYGSGGASFATIDIAGHEVAHGLTTNTAALIYSYESGALNESFSDIFGAAIEFYAEGAIGDWLLGEDRGSVIRYMNNPNLGGDPDTYLGDFWHTAAWDNGGVHINSGVQNFWFYLLTEGGSGTNDLNDNYSVDALGVEKAQAIAFRNLTVYLTPSSQYFDARFYAIQSAIDLFGNCSEEVGATTDAWYAVGVGDAYVEGVEADFDPSKTEICELPHTVSFVNGSSNADTYVWDFGDGNNSSLESPSHTYTQEGVFTVMLDVSSDCGEDEKSKIITIELPLAPTSATAEVCPGDVAELFATPNISGTTLWYDDSVSSIPIYEGDTFITPVVNSTIPYYVSTKTNGNLDEVGESDNNFGPGSPFNGLQYLVFDVYEPAILDSVRIYATGSGEREFVLLDAFGNEITSMIVDLENGEQMVELGMELPVGTDLQIGLGNDGDLNLYRNASGSEYPYDINGVLSIKRSTAFTNGGLSHYYFFYNWHVSYGHCESPKTLVYASVSECLGVDDITSDDVTIFPNPSNGSVTITWDKMTVNTIDVQNMHGQLVSRFKPNTTQIEMNLSSGVYMVNIIGSKGTTTKSVIVQ